MTPRRRALLAVVVLAVAAGAACRSTQPTPPPGPSDEMASTTHDAAAERTTGPAPAEPDATGWWPRVDAAGAQKKSDELWAQCDHVPVEEHCRDGWCEIPAGCFVMGSREDEWGHPMYQEDQVLVTLTRSFIIQQTEVTQGAWTAQGLTNPSIGENPDGTGDCLEPSCPVDFLTWFEALTYANLLSQAHDPPLEPCYTLIGCQGEVGRDFYCTAAETTQPTIYECEGYRLLTDAEWEYAARAGTRTAFYSGDITVHPEFERDPTACLPDAALERIGWYCWNSGRKTHPVGQLDPNGWGLYDMSGNASELLSERNDGLPPRTDVDPGGTVGLHTSRSRRGGAAWNWSSLCRSANELSSNWNLRLGGLRLARTGTLDDL